jgi:predicted nucleotidyltransferase
MAIPAPTIDADLEAVKAALAGVQPRPGRVLLFGSRARGDARPDSDLDLLVVMPQATLTPQERQQPLDVYAFPKLSSASLQVSLPSGRIFSEVRYCAIHPSVLSTIHSKDVQTSRYSVPISKH